MNLEEPSRFKIVENHPPTLPGCCALTGIQEDEWFFQVEDGQAFHGVFYISKTAFEELASLVGFGPKTSRNKLKEELNGLDPLLSSTLDRLRNYSASLLPAQELIDSVNHLSRTLTGLTEGIARSAEQSPKQTTSA